MFLSTKLPVKCDVRDFSRDRGYLGESQRLFYVFVPDELDEVLLLQVEKQVSVGIEQIGMQLVDQRRGFLNFPRLDAVPDPDALVQPFQFLGCLKSSLQGEFLCSFLKSLFNKFNE